ncbi:MAG TPA: alpha-amylase family glycosyl hydrolase [Candidatus Saccharimonadales bacterium]|nr:alpha-amylase family glycosyl hydrolase [Candidatus Saccharimonadales bacterium]
MWGKKLSANWKKSEKWWHGSIVYHIYPRSYYDANDDGIGDLKGITEKLDYLAGKPDSLGVNAIWLSPFYPSPMADMGYDVCDYQNVDPTFGNLEDFDVLVEESHRRGIRVFIDFVPNHTSDQHSWFKESRSSKDNPYRDWYIWRPAREDGSLPNNWLSVFGGSVWQFDKETNEYYLHTFMKQQPDLNWDNPKVREAMKDNMRFWLARGVDGFRIDAVSWLSKDPQLRDDPLNPMYHQDEDHYLELVHNFSCEGPKLFDYLNEMVDVCAEFGNRFMITEAYPDVPGEISHYLNYYEKLHHNLCAPFNFECISFPWDALSYRGFIDKFQESILPGQPPIYVMGNHDKPRLATRLGRPAARTAAMLLLTLPGIPFIYYGDELGMNNVKLDDNHADAKDSSHEVTRRYVARTPMQWSNDKNAGFSKEKPWLPPSADYKEYNVQAESTDKASFFYLYKKLIEFRKESPALRFGTYRSIDLSSDVFGFVRELNMERFTVVLNFSDQEQEVHSKALKGSVVFSTYLDEEFHGEVKDKIKLRPNEGVVISVF